MVRHGGAMSCRGRPALRIASTTAGCAALEPLPMVPLVADQEQPRGGERAWTARSAQRADSGTLSAGKRTLTEQLQDHAPRRMPRGTPVIAGGSSRASEIANRGLPRLHLLGVPPSGGVPLFAPTGLGCDGDHNPLGTIAEVPYRAEMERAFGEDFGSVRAELGADLGDIGALGAARTEVVAFESQQPDRGAVAHELAHVVQHRRARSAMPSTPIEDADSAAEQEAELVAARIVAGERAPQVRQVPTGEVARIRPGRAPTPPPRPDARTWIGHMLVLAPLRADVSGYLTDVHMPPVHPRLTWTSAGTLAVRVWGAIGNATRLQLALTPLDIFARIDQVRELGEPTTTSGPLTYVPEVAPIIARELETALRHSVQRLGPRLVAAFDASSALQTTAARDASAISPDALVFSHPLDAVVEEVLRQGAIATIRARRPEDDEPAPDRATRGVLRPVSFRWVDDPALWNWIRTEPADATPEEVAKQLLGSTIRAYELGGTAPFYALPPSHAQAIVTAGTNRYTVYEHSSGPPPDAIREATAHARGRVAELERRPGSKVNLPANPADARLLEAAHAAAGPGAPASRVLDELHHRMSPDQQRALEAFHRKMGDAPALRAIESTVTRQDLTQFLNEKLLSNPERVRLQAEIATARAELARARMAELGIAGDGLMQSRVQEDASALIHDLAPGSSVDASRVTDAVKRWDVREIVGDLGEAIGRAQLHADAANAPGRSVLSNIEIVTRVSGSRIIKEWQQAQRAQGQPDNPKGLYEADGKLWRSITEVDNLVVERTARGALRPVLMEQVKSGVDDRPVDAAKQNTKALDALQAAAAGSRDIAVYDRVGKNTLGAERGGELDLSHLDGLTLKTRGLPGKNLDPRLGDHFDAALDLGGTTMSAKEARSLLEDLARELLGAKVAELLKLAPGAGK